MYEYSVTPLESPPPSLNPSSDAALLPSLTSWPSPGRSPASGLPRTPAAARPQPSPRRRGPPADAACANSQARSPQCQAAPQVQGLNEGAHLSGANGTGQVEDANGLAEWVAILAFLCDSQALELRIGVSWPDLRMEVSAHAQPAVRRRLPPPPPRTRPARSPLLPNGKAGKAAVDARSRLSDHGGVHAIAARDLLHRLLHMPERKAEVAALLIGEIRGAVDCTDPASTHLVSQLSTRHEI